jgi:hypothetical protein
MTDRYRAAGKQVLRDREHVADAADETYAQIIADALNDRVASTDPDGTIWRPVPIPVDDPNGRVIQTREVIGEYADENNVIQPAGFAEHCVIYGTDGTRRCSCGRSWDRDEGDDCPGETS